MAETKLTFCRICEAGCGLSVTVEDNRVLRIEPDKNHVVSKGYACIKGVRFGSVQHSPDRVSTPLKRVGDEFVPISWDQAIAEIGDKLRELRKEHGPDSIALYIGSPMPYNFAAGLMQNAFVDGLGTRSVYGAGSQDCANKFVVSQHMYGSPFRLTFPDLENIETFIALGSNPAVSQMTFIQSPDALGRLRAVTERGGRVVWVNPRKTETARSVGEHLFIRPDTDVFFLLSFAHELFRTGGIDRDRAAAHLSRVEVLEQVSAAWPAERTAQVTGISAEALRELVKRYRESNGAALYCATGVNQGTNGTLAFWLLEAINAVSGNLDKRGGTLVGRGLYDMPAFLKKAGKLERKDRTRIGDLPSVTDTFPAVVLADEILTPGKGQVRALINLGGNPVLSCPGSGGKLDEALSKLELLVCVDLFRNETGNLAHYVLPSTTFLERPDIPMVLHWMGGTQPQRYVQYTDAVLTPSEGVREESWIFLKLGLRAKLPLFGNPVFGLVFRWLDRLGRLPLIGHRFALTPERIIAGALRLFKETAPLKEQRERHPHGQRLPPNEAGNFLGQRVLHPDGRVDVAPQLFVDTAKKLEVDFARELEQRHAIKIVSKREKRSHNTWLHNIEGFVDDKRSTNYLYMNPRDAEQLGLADGELATVSSPQGSIEIPVQVTDEMMQGAAALPHGWGHQKADALPRARRYPGSNVNVLTPTGAESCEKLSGMTHMTGIIVDVRPARAKANAAE
jgi:anaerobic selenocysteine-containing dehydrogenase